MQLIPVFDKSTARQFLDLSAWIHRDNPEWIRPLDKDIEEVFDPVSNKLFRQKENQCARWLLQEESGRVVGRIAAFVNKKYRNRGDEVPVGGIGFFECIDDQKAADMMFDHARDWLAKHGMEAMDGPINFGERDRWWGLVVEGFHAPLYCMNYNPPYYQKLFENYGFRLYFNQVCFALKVRDDLQQKFYTRHAQIAADPDFHAEYFRKKDADKYASDFCTVYNMAWAGHGGNKSLELRQAKNIVKSMLPVIDESVIWFVYHKGDPVACWMNLPDLNQWFKHLHGKFGFWSKLKFLWVKRFARNARIVGLVFGVVPEFQGKGIDAYMIVEGARRIQREMKYEDYEMQWIGDFNPKMINIAENLGTVRSRRLVTYRYLFDRSREFSRHPMIG